MGYTFFFHSGLAVSAQRHGPFFSAKTMGYTGIPFLSQSQLEETGFFQGEIC